MKLDDLLAEYGAALSSAESEGLPPFEELQAKRRRPVRVCPPVRVWWLAAAAAGLALWLVSPRPERPPMVKSARAQPELVRVQPEVALRPLAAPALRPPRRRGLTSKVTAAPRPAPRRESAFVALAENSMLPKPAFVQMVRVGVRPERLAELGVAWRGQAAPDGLVGAEVLLGDDGIARALRVLNQE